MLKGCVSGTPSNITIHIFEDFFRKVTMPNDSFLNPDDDVNAFYNEYGNR